jgi:hypothetical protein
VEGRDSFWRGNKLALFVFKNLLGDRDRKIKSLPKHLATAIWV